MARNDVLPGALVSALRDSDSVCVLTGAGVSAESGVPTFREAQTGLWAQHRPESLATMQAFLADPAFVWSWYRWRRELVTKVEPNPGHGALAELESRYTHFTLVTQNVDGLHRRAGSRNVVEFHGDLFTDICINGCREAQATDRQAAQATDTPEAQGNDADDVPRCSQCGDLLRPGVVWFGEAIPEQALRDATAAASTCDVMLCIGTSAQVYPAAGLTELAKRHGAVTAEINPEPTGGPEFDHVIRGPSGLILPDLVASLMS